MNRLTWGTTGGAGVSRGKERRSAIGRCEAADWTVLEGTTGSVDRQQQSISISRRYTKPPGVHVLFLAHQTRWRHKIAAAASLQIPPEPVCSASAFHPSQPDMQPRPSLPSNYAPVFCLHPRFSPRSCAQPAWILCNQPHSCSLASGLYGSDDDDTSLAT